MMCSVSIITWCAFLHVAIGAAEDIPEQAGEVAFRALLREYEVARQENTDRGPDSSLRRFPERFLALAKAHPESLAACSALGWVISHGPGGPRADTSAYNSLEVNATVVDTAAEILARDHARDAALGPICPDLVNHIRSATVEDLLRQVVEQNPSREIRGLAYLSLARYLAALSDSDLQRRLNPRTNGFIDRSLVKRLRDADPEAMGREAETLLGLLIEQYADVEHQGARLGELARRDRDQLRDFAIGRQAPEIAGEDLDGKPMKLSDHRGKVIVLNFSSHEYCGICRTYYPFQRSLVERLKDRPFVFLGVECDDHREPLLKARDEGEITWRCWWDGGSTEGPIATRWNVEGWPTIFIIDHKGVIRYKGLVTDAMAMAVEALLAERDEETATDSSAPPRGRTEPGLPLAPGFAQVVQVAEAISNEAERATVLSQIAAAWVRDEGEDAARPIFQRAIDLAQGSVASAKDGKMRGHLLVRLAMIQIEAGDRDGARSSLRHAIACANDIEQAASRHDLMQFIAHVQGEAGDVEGSRATANTSGPFRVGVLTDLAKGRAKAGDVTGALSLLASIGDEDDENARWAAAWILPEVALAQAKAEDRTEARRTIKRSLAAFDLLRDKSRDPTLLARIAHAHAQAGDREGSRATFQRALHATDNAEDFPAAEYLVMVALAQWEAGDKDDARGSLHKAVERIEGRDRNPQVDDLLAQAFLALNDLARALDIARVARNSQGNLTLTPDVVRQLAQAQIRSRNADGILDWVTERTSLTLRAYALLGAVEGARIARR